MKTKEKPRIRFEGTDEINANHYPIENSRFIRLLSHDELNRLKKGVVLFSIAGEEITVGKSKLNIAVWVFGRSMYGELI